MRLAAAILCLIAARTTQAQDCAAVLEHPSYPTLARQARISGTVAARFLVGESGSAGAVEIQGHPILAREVDRVLTKTTFPAHCRSQHLEVVIDFRLQDEPADEAHTTVSFPSPGKVEVTSNITGIICMLNSKPAGPRSRFLRFLRALAAPIQ